MKMKKFAQVETTTSPEENITKIKYDESFPYCHAEKVHNSFQFSPLSKEYSGPLSFRGFIHLAVLLLGVNTLRSIFENYLKYGILLSMPFTKISSADWQYFTYIIM